MTWLIAGVLVWSAVHLMPALARGLRANLISRLGAPAYKIGFALLILAAIVLMVLGWRATPPVLVYLPPTWGYHATGLLMLIAFILFAASHGKSNIKRLLRHPQLSGVIVWAIAHLLANGESRSLILFGSIGLWAIIEIVLINQREGVWQKPEPQTWKVDIRPILGGIIVYAVMIFLHPYLFGVSPIPH